MKVRVIIPQLGGHRLFIVCFHFQLNEPGGLCVGTDQNKLYIADTNNHSVKVLDFRTAMITEVCTVTATAAWNSDQGGKEWFLTLCLSYS